MRAELTQGHFTALPGEPFLIEVDVFNTGSVIDGVRVAIPDLPPDLVVGQPDFVALFPETADQLRLLVTFPADYQAGTYAMQVEVSSDTGEPPQTLEATVDLVELSEPGITAHPQSISAKKRASIEVICENTGNATTSMSLFAVDPEQALSFVFEASTVDLPPQSQVEVGLDIYAPRRVVGGIVTRPVTIIGVTPSGKLEFHATFVHKPLIPQGLLTMGVLASIVALWVGAFVLAITRILDTEPLTKDVSVNFYEPAAGAGRDLDLTVVGSTGSGRVVAPGGQPLAGVLVSAVRATSEGDTEEAAAATDEDGSYTIGPLAPGRYYLRYRLQGPPNDDDDPENDIEIWFPGDPERCVASSTDIRVNPSKEPRIPITRAVLTASRHRHSPGPEKAQRGSETEHANRQRVRIDDNHPLADDVVVCGEQASISGRVGAFGGEVASIEVRAVLDEASLEEPLHPSPLAQPKVVAPGDSYLISGLPTPGIYEVTISPRSTTRRFSGAPARESVVVVLAADGSAAGGEGLALPTSSIEGVVRGPTGLPLSDVTVTARLGADMFVATTPADELTSTSTADTAGTYRLEDLAAGTYVVTFSHPQLAETTRVIELQTRATRDAATTCSTRPYFCLRPADVVLERSTFTLHGVIRAEPTAGGGAAEPVGQATVRVQSNGVDATVPTDATGRYSIPGVPIETAVALTVSREGYAPETKIFKTVIDDVGELRAGLADLTLDQLTVTLGGAITDASGAALVGAIVRVQIGAGEREVIAGPDGRYEFADLAYGAVATLNVSMEGFSGQTQVVELTDAVGEIDIALESAEAAVEEVEEEADPGAEEASDPPVDEGD